MRSLRERERERESSGSPFERVYTRFDKDDALAMLFVSAAANLRSSVFGIELQSLYACKGIAGNIIPAIATTTAMATGGGTAHAAGL